MSTQLPKTVNTWLNQLWNNLLPTPCTLCGDPTNNGEIICPPCSANLPINTIYCPRCALPMPRPEICGQCLRHPPAFDRVIAPFIYKPPVDRLIGQLKYNNRLAAGRTFAKFLEQPIELLNEPLPEALIAIPLHQQRIKQRGFNQSLEIARPLAKRIHRPLLTNLVQRHKFTTPQTGLTGAARRKNLRGAFSITTPLAHRHLALIDDVMTTGSTAQELAITLKKAGAARVDIWVVTRVDSKAHKQPHR
ncbi:MAG: ComF family protein [Gammaproteobacteria bacterium]|nr:MAG: ComF family protein [Gammaproteobacteria bacterium]RLA14321.1 MAG: ComF family protein [Gammaproteobacteria bacterium]